MLSLRPFLMFTIFCITFAAAQSGPGQFTLTVYQPGSPVDGQVVNAAGSAFYLGGSPVTYCPLTSQTLCPAGNQTIFAGMVAMFVEVPGGQQVYTTTAGALGYTEAHSILEPPGAYIGGFTNVTITSECDVPIYLINWQTPSTNDTGTKGIFACPEPVPESGNVTYQIYANTPDFNQTNCISVDGLLPHYTPSGVYGAWQYM